MQSCAQNKDFFFNLPNLEVFFLTKNMRLEDMLHREDLTPQEIIDIQHQKNYSSMSTNTAYVEVHCVW